MPQLEPWSYMSQIFWLVITFITLYFVLSKVVVPRITSVLEARQEKIEDDLGRAERLRVEAEQVLEEYNKALDDARSEAQGLLKQSAEEMAAHAANRNEAVGADLAARNREAEGRIAEARRQALDNIKPAAAEVAAAALAKLVGGTPDQAKVAQAVDSVSAESQG